MKHLLFVCFGNICRSPAAEGIMNFLVDSSRLKGKVVCDSAATSDGHLGASIDNRVFIAAKNRGYTLKGKSRQFKASIDFNKFDLILTMDNSIFEHVITEDPEDKYGSKIIPLTHFCKAHNVEEVPDPYDCDVEKIEASLDIIEDACHELLNHLKSEIQS